MIEQTHAEMQQEHYRAVRTNPMYRLEGMMDVLREELAMNMPVYSSEETIPVYQDMEWTRQQWDKVQQIENELIGWREKHATVLLEIDKLKAMVERGRKHYKY